MDNFSVDHAGVDVGDSEDNQSDNVGNVEFLQQFYHTLTLMQTIHSMKKNVTRSPQNSLSQRIEI